MTTSDLARMVKLRLAGWGYSKLGREFQKDHTTIMYHCRRLGLPIVEQKRKVKTNIIVNEINYYEQLLIEAEELQYPKVLPKYAHLIDEEVNKGKSYKEYIAESRLRPIEKRYYEIYHTTYAEPKVSKFTLLAEIEEENRSGLNPDDTRMV